MGTLFLSFVAFFVGRLHTSYCLPYLRSVRNNNMKWWVMTNIDLACDWWFGWVLMLKFIQFILVYCILADAKTSWKLKAWMNGIYRPHLLSSLFKILQVYDYCVLIIHFQVMIECWMVWSLQLCTFDEKLHALSYQGLLQVSRNVFFRYCSRYWLIWLQLLRTYLH